MNKMKWNLIAALLLIFSSFCVGSYAQNVYAALHGTVTDSSSAVVPGAAVTTLNTSTGIKTTAQADKSGYYIFPQLQVGGPYTVTVTAPGFQTFTSTGLTLNVNDNREVDAKLTVGAESQTVEVSATALQVDTSDTQLKQIATADQLEGIPLEGRDPDGLQKLQPGVVESSDRTGAYSSNGSQTAQNSYVLNGTDINDGPLQDVGILINPDALQEVNIVTSTMNPEFARNSGSVVNQILKAGTNQIHGSGFEFYRDTFMNNGNYFSTTHPVFHQNLYGGTLGGPILKNKLFLFVAYQGLRNRTGTTTTNPTFTGTKSGTTPTGQFAGAFSSDPNYGNGNSPNNTPFDNTVIQKNGKVPCPNIPAKVYSDSLSCNLMPFAVNGVGGPRTTWIQAYDNGSGATTPATINIPTTAWDPIALNLVNNYIPQANAGSASYNFNSPNTHAQDQGILRLDYALSTKDSVWASSVFQSSPSFNTLSFGGATLPGFAQNNAEHYKIFNASWTHTFNPNLLNEVHGGYFRFNYPDVIPATPSQPGALGFAITPQSPLSGVPFMEIGTSYIDLGNSPEGPQPRIDTNATYGDSVIWVRGNHSFKFGGSFEQFRVRNTYGAQNNGEYKYEGGGTYSSNIDFTLGIPDTYVQTSDGFIDAVAMELYGYAQDNWKMTPDLTINLGIGWDAEGPNQNRQDASLGIICWQNSSSSSKVFPGGPPGLSWPGDPGCNAAGGPTTHYDRFGPRVGVAWSPSSGPAMLFGDPGSHKLSIRAGFGLYYNRDMEEQSLQNLADPPFFFTSNGAASAGGSPGFKNPFQDVTGDPTVSEPNPFPYLIPKVGDVINWNAQNELDLAAFSPSYSIPYTYNFNLNIQRSLGFNLIAQVGYVGSVSHRLSSWYEGDPVTSAGHAACAAASCNPASIHLANPQDTAQPAILTGSVSTSAPNGIPWYLSVADQTTEGSSNYNSLQASLIKASSHGLQFTVAYTYSHALDDFSGYESSFGGEQSGYGSFGRELNYVPGFQYLNYGSSDFDARHHLSTSYVYSVPVAGFLKSNRILAETLGGWGISGVTAVQSGNPIGISYGEPASGWCDEFSYFGCPDVPETSSFKIATYNPRSKPTGTGTNQYFDTTPFSPQPAYTFGNTTRNFFHGPGLNYTNLSVTKNIHFSNDEKRYVQLRLEGFNAFNHANFQPPSGIFLSSTFGQVSSVVQSEEGNADPSPGRAVQLAGKIYF